MGRRHHHKRHKKRLINYHNKRIIEIIVIGLFLFFAYQYYTKNVMDAFFTMLIQLPLINEVVRGWVYWLIVGVIGFGIWWVIEKKL